jgi:beta-fructofuranosidase
MECPTLIKFGNKWYLTFSDQWPDRVVHYRVSDSISGPFTKPEVETIDGNGFYAGRLETDGTDLYMVGWNGTKIGHDDANDYDWAGNMVVHKLAQNSDGSLVPVVNDKVTEQLSHKRNMKPLKMTETVTAKNDTYQLKGDQYELVQYEGFITSGRVEMDITDYADDEMFGIAFAPDFENVGTLNYVFNVPENRIEFYNTDHLTEGYAQSYMDYDLKAGEPLHISLFVYDGVVSMYVNDKIALTSRMYRSNGTNWQLFGLNSDVTFSNVAAYN